MGCALGYDLFATVDTGSFLTEEILFALLDTAGLATLGTLALIPVFDLGINSIVCVGIVGFLLTAFDTTG